MTPDELIDRVRRALPRIAALRAVFLGGSHGRHEADRYSDVDLVALTRPGAEADFAKAWRRVLESIEPVVLWTERDRGNLLINAVLQSWLRCDMLVMSEERLRRQPRDTVVPLLDREGIFATLPAHSARPKVDPQHLHGLINEFLRILGLLAVAMGRAEYPNAVVGVGHLRNLLIALMIEERNPLHRGGALHLNRLLDPEQLAVLTALPAVDATRESVIAGHLAYADAFLPRARRMASAHGVDWPTAFEAATWAYLERELGLKRGAATESGTL